MPRLAEPEAPTFHYRDDHDGFRSLPELDAPLLYDLVCWAEFDEAAVDDPRFGMWGSWDQGSWAWTEEIPLTEEQRREELNGACKTSYCIAGQAVHQAGYRMIYSTPNHNGVGVSASLCVQQEPTGETTQNGLPIMRDVQGAEMRDISDTARGVLGLTTDEADMLFSGDNDVYRLQCLANTFALARRLPPLFANVGIEQVGRGEVDEYWTVDDPF